MRITICDDEEKHLAQIAAYTSEYLKKQNLDITLKEFISPHELLNYEYINGGSTIYLLDIVMEGMSGLELAQRLREYNHKALIIFLTTAREFSLEAFSVHAFSYLLKPLDKAALFAEFDKCFTYCLPLQKPEIVITVKTAEGLIPLRLEQINAVEYSEHHQRQLRQHNNQAIYRLIRILDNTHQRNRINHRRRRQTIGSQHAPAAANIGLQRVNNLPPAPAHQQKQQRKKRRAQNNRRPRIGRGKNQPHHIRRLLHQIKNRCIYRKQA